MNIRIQILVTLCRACTPMSKVALGTGEFTYMVMELRKSNFYYGVLMEFMASMDIF